MDTAAEDRVFLMGLWLKTRRFAACVIAGVVWIICPPALGKDAGALATLQAGPVGVQENNPFSALVGEKQERPLERPAAFQVERYVLASDERVFLFEDRGASARMRFLCTPDDKRIECALDPEGPAAEIYVLSPTRGPRGDVIYKNAEGETLLRLASYGGATVYWPGDNGAGRAASRSFGDDTMLALGAATYESAERRATLASRLISSAVGVPVMFELNVEGRSADARYDGQADVLADAIIRAAAAIHIVASDETGARVIAERINKVLITPARAAGVRLDQRALIIEYAPGSGLTGRPGSATIIKFLEETL